MSAFTTLLTTVVVAYLSTFLYRFIRNFFNARKTGFPSIIIPWDQNHLVWMIVSVPLRPWLKRWMPKWIYDRISLCIYGFEFSEKLRPFQQFSGPRGDDKSFMLVTCGRSEFTTRDPEIALQILNRTRDFYQFELSELFMAVFGHNVLTSHGDSWTRQRKIVASVINERISKAAFDEAIRQTNGLLAEVGSRAEDGMADTNQLFDMAKKITINVLSGAGMGASIAWEDDRTEKPEPGFKQTYIQSVKAVLDGITGPILLPQWLLLNYPSFLPGHQLMKSVGYAVAEFPLHTTNMLEQERERVRIGDSVDNARNNIMSQLLHASEHPESTEFDKNSARKRALSDEEMMGNLFVFTGAGFDTTANTISYALVLLARYPQWQAWLLEETDSIFPPEAEAELEYTALFPKATRLLAFMFETLRLFTPLIHISKQTRAPQTFQTSKGSFWLPANTTVYVHAIGLHLDPEVWCNLNHSDGEEALTDDASVFRPTRWINRSGSPLLFQPPKGQYVPWSTGPRVCPGQKMAQVEFVAVFLALLRHHKIDAVPLRGESRAQVDSRLDMRMQDSISILTLQMNDVYDVSESSTKGLTLRLSRR